MGWSRYWEGVGLPRLTPGEGSTERCYGHGGRTSQRGAPSGKPTVQTKLLPGDQVERVRSWLTDEDWETLGQAAHYARANLAKVVGRVPGALGTLLDVVGELGLEDAGRLGAAVAKVASLLEEGDLQALEDTIGEILEAGQVLSAPVDHLFCLSGLFGLTFLLPNIIIIIFILKVRLW